MKRLINIYWNKPKYLGLSIFSNEGSFTKGFSLISIFYFLVLFVAFQSITFNTQFPSWIDIIDSKSYFTPQWSSKWMTFVDWSFAVKSVFVYFILSSILGVLFWSRSIIVRIIVALGMFQYLSLISSFTIVDHYLHMMVIASIIFIFIPSREAHNYKSDLLKVIFGLQTIILASYSVSGFYKLLGIAKQLKWGVTSVFSTTGMTLQSGKTSYFSGHEYFFQQFLTDHPSYWFGIFHLSGYLIEFFSLFILFKINLHRIWGLVLILFHLAIALTIGPDFSIHILTIGLFLLFSPFGAQRYDLWEDLKSHAYKNKKVL